MTATYRIEINQRVSHDDALVSRMTPADVRRYFEKLSDFHRGVNNSPFYRYVLSQAISLNNQPCIHGDLVDWFYASIKITANRFRHADDTLFDLGHELSLSALSAAEVQSKIDQLLQSCYQLVSVLEEINLASLDASGVIRRMNQPARSETGRLQKQVGADKEETFRETLRRYIPAWMRMQVPAPELDDTQAMEVLNRCWTTYTPNQAHLLVHPERVADGAPLHWALQVASEINNPQSSYAVKTWAVTEVLRGEAEGKTSARQEMPFFHYILAGIITGRAAKVGKGAYFDFGSALTELMGETILQLRSELVAKTPGLACEFIQDLYGFFGSDLAPLFSQGLFLQEARLPQLDANEIFELLKAINTNWASAIVEQIPNMINRRVISIEEAGKVLSAVSTWTYLEEHRQRLLGNAVELLEDNDGVSFTKTGAQTNSRVEFHVDINAPSEQIEVTMMVTSGGVSRDMTFSMGFSDPSQEIDPSHEIHFSKLNGQPSQELTKLCQKLTASVIAEQVLKRRQNKPASPTTQGAWHRSTQTVTDTQSQRRHGKRDDRIKQHQLQVAQREALAPEIASAPVVAHSEFSPDDETDNLYEKFQVVNLDENRVERLLEAEGITFIQAAIVTRKLRYLINVATAARKMPGKKINPAYYSARGFHLRQVSWYAEGDTAIRYYLQHTSNGNFMLVGILHKKSFSMQKRYIEALIQRINR